MIYSTYTSCMHACMLHMYKTLAFKRPTQHGGKGWSSESRHLKSRVITIWIQQCTNEINMGRHIIVFHRAVSPCLRGLPHSSHVCHTCLLFWHFCPPPIFFPPLALPMFCMQMHIPRYWYKKPWIDVCVCMCPKFAEAPARICWTYNELDCSRWVCLSICLFNCSSRVA